MSEDELTLILGNIEREHFGVPPMMKIAGEGWALARKKARAAIAALSPATWQPIETAPKDGTWVLIHEAHGINTKFSAIDVGRYHLGEWQNSDKTRLANATEWMPLPARPSAAVSSAKELL